MNYNKAQETLLKCFKLVKSENCESIPNTVWLFCDGVPFIYSFDDGTVITFGMRHAYKSATALERWVKEHY